MEIIIRATVIFFFLWGIARATGKRELSELNAFEMILIITMGDLVQQGVTQEDMSLTGAMLAVGTFAMWIVIFAVISHRYPRSSRVLDGLPVVIVRDGQLLREQLNVERVPDYEVRQAARNQGIDDLEKVKIGVLEPDGKISFLQELPEQHQAPEKHAQ